MAHVKFAPVYEYQMNFNAPIFRARNVCAFTTRALGFYEWTGARVLIFLSLEIYHEQDEFYSMRNNKQDVQFHTLHHRKADRAFTYFLFNLSRFYNYNVTFV